VSLAPPKHNPLVPGQRLDRYELLAPVAQGGMAWVWLARLQGAHGFEKLVAIKTILPEYAQDPRFQKMFLDEAHIASGIVHSNVAQILDLGEEQGVLYLVMEWVDGDALSRLNRAVEKQQKTIPIGVTLRVLADACGGLHAAHELKDKQGQLLGVVHRDVSPHNILVDVQGIAKLIDFGIAKARDRLADETNAGLLKGKLAYMAPEQALGKPLDRRADVWAIGAVLYQLLSHRPPYDGPNQLATLHLLTSGRPAQPLPKSVPEPVLALVKKSLTHSRDDRFSTALEMQQAIETAMVESGCTATIADVARYIHTELTERQEKRKLAIAMALDAATDRVRLEALLAPSGGESSSGLIEGAYLRVVGSRNPTPLLGSKEGAGSEGRLPATLVAEPTADPTEEDPFQQRAAIGGLKRATGTTAGVATSAPAFEPGKVGEIMFTDFDQGKPAAPILVEPKPTVAASPKPPRHGSREIEMGPPIALANLTTDPTSTRDRSLTGARAIRRESSRSGRGLVYGLGALAIVLAAGSLLELTKHGAFLRHDIVDRASASRYEELVTIAKQRTTDAFAQDDLTKAKAAVDANEKDLAEAPRHAPLLAYVAYSGFALQVRFGPDGALDTRANAALQKIDGDPKEKRLAIAAKDVLKGNLSSARTALQEMLRADAKNVEALALLGELELRDHHVADSLDAFGRLLAIADVPRGHAGRMRALYGAGDMDGARKEATSLAKSNATHAGSRLMLARIAWRRDKDEAQATRWLEELAGAEVSKSASTIERAEAAALRGSMHLAAGRVQDAKKAYESAVTITGGATSTEIEIGLGDVSLASGEVAKAMAHYRTALESAPSNPEAKAGLAAAQKKLDQGH